MSVDPVTELPSRPSPGAAGAQLGELYADHSRLVYGICRMLLRDPDEAEDATQQVFLSAYKNLLTGTRVRDPAAWLGTIARNASRRRATARMHEPLAMDEQPTLVSPAADVQASGREEASALYAELAALPAKQREAVVLRDLYGLRYDEVAAALGTSRPAVEALLFRGRRRLKVRLRPGLAAGVLVVPLAVQESIAYAVPGFASTAVPAGAVATAAGIPLLAKLAAAGAAVGIAGSAGYATERSLHDPPARPAAAKHAETVEPRPLAEVEPIMAAALLPPPPAGSPIAEARKDERDDAERSGRGDQDEQKSERAGESEDEPEDTEAGRDDGEAEEAEVEELKVEDVEEAEVEEAEADDRSGEDGESREGVDEELDD
ncbi:MAG TPA: sigma-70 family RNA polymerase sigma factor [Gaiellaceae bacterium]|nr:sigma-70 family RNA polymerase sigma factor [Gaiellaceae bacterium]